MMIADYRTRLRRPVRNPRGVPHESTVAVAAIARDPRGTYRAKFRGARFGHGLYNGYFASEIGADPNGKWVELWYGNHPVALGFSHSKLWLISDEPDFWDDVNDLGIGEFAVNEIEDDNSWSLSRGKPDGICTWAISTGAGQDIKLDEMFAAINRSTDSGQDLFNATLVSSLSSTTAMSFIRQLRSRNRVMNYNFEQTSLEYETFPGRSYTAWDEWDEYNSNSYVSGILEVLGYTAPSTTGTDTPGYKKPVPDFVFTTTFRTTYALKRAFRQNYPSF